MISGEEFVVLDGMRTKLNDWAAGKCVSLTREEYLVISPILKTHVHYVGSLSCRYCVLEMFRHCYGLMCQYDEYLKSLEEVTVEKPKRGRPKKNV